MGIISRAYTVIGFKIKEQDLIENTINENMSCNCEMNSTKYKYCPSCGIFNTFGKPKYILNYTKYNYEHEEEYYEDDFDFYEDEEEYEMCNCKLNSVDFNYCPECGFGNNYETYLISCERYFPEYNPENDGDGIFGSIIINNTKYRTFKLMKSDYVYISIHITSCHGNNYESQNGECLLSFEKLCELKEKLMEDLCTVDKWKNDIEFINNFNKNFKIYTISCICST